jgi:hypothetical protein
MEPRVRQQSCAAGSSVCRATLPTPREHTPEISCLGGRLPCFTAKRLHRSSRRWGAGLRGRAGSSAIASSRKSTVACPACQPRELALASLATREKRVFRNWCTPALPLPRAAEVVAQSHPHTASRNSLAERKPELALAALARARSMAAEGHRWSRRGARVGLRTWEGRRKGSGEGFVSAAVVASRERVGVLGGGGAASCARGERGEWLRKLLLLPLPPPPPPTSGDLGTAAVLARGGVGAAGCKGTLRLCASSRS